jgi:hypothetical protein
MAGAGSSVQAADLQAWHDRGWFTVDLPANLVAAARAEANFGPSPAAPANVTAADDAPPAPPLLFGSNGTLEFPCGLRALDMLPFALLPWAQALLRRPVISQADCWIKYALGGAKVGAGSSSGGVDGDEAQMMSNHDQRMHCDWGNNQLLPPEWERPTAVSALVSHRVCAG